EATHARRQVRVGGSARQQPAERRDHLVEPHAVEGREHARRPGDLEDAKLTAGPEHPPKLAHACLEIVDVANAEADGDRVEGRVRERKRKHVAAHPLDRSILCAGALEHPFREVETDDLAAAVGGGDREVAGPAARVEHAVAGPDDALDGDPPPALTEPRRHQPVHRVVDRRDAVEHPAHALRGQAAGLYHYRPHRFAACSMPSWSSARATTKSTRSSTVSAPW